MARSRALTRSFLCSHLTQLLRLSAVAKSTTPQPAVSPEEFEWQAFDAAETERARRYFEAGDRYLKETNDVDAAMRCYRLAFRYATPAERRVRPTDSWLVATLKSETFPEDRR